MTTRQVFALCIVLSTLLHVWAIQHSWSQEDNTAPSGLKAVPLDFDVVVSCKKYGTALTQTSEETKDVEDYEETARRLRRLAIHKFITQVRESIEQRKFLSGNGDLSRLIGNVRYGFKILPDDSFSDIRLLRSSGNPTLDQAAKRAIITASGVTKRPKLLQGQTFTIPITIKYQKSM